MGSDLPKMPAPLPRRLFVATVAAFGVAALPETAWGEVRQWTVGGGEGESWASRKLTATGVDFSQPEFIQTQQFNPQANITRQLSWSHEKPRDFVVERAQALVWNNSLLKESDLVIVDGDPATSTEDRFKEFGIEQDGRRFEFDLGSRIPVNRIVFFPRPAGTDARGRPYSEDFIRSYALFFSDGLSFSKDNRPDYTLLRQVEFTREDTAESLFPLQFVRYLRLDVNSTNPFEIAEFQVFGKGFAPKASYRSGVVDLREDDLREVANFTRLHWSVEGLRQEEAGPVAVEEVDAEISVRMRTGTDDSPMVFYRLVDSFTKEREEVTEDQYGKLRAGERLEPEDDQVNWSLWSSPFTVSGQGITLPGPRRFFQFEIAMQSRDILEGLRVATLSVEHSIPPLARQLLGEVSVLDEPRPPRKVAVVPAGEFSTFAYDVIADVGEADIGFDALRIFTPASEPRFRELLMGDSLERVGPADVEEAVGSLTLLFPDSRRIAQRDGLRVIFDAEVFVQGTFLDAEVFDTRSEEPSQRVLSGDANPEVTTNKLRVLTTAASAADLVPSFAVAPRVITPNGDGLNDEAGIWLTLMQLVRPVEVEVEIFDLAGRKVGTLLAPGESGIHTISWNGRDEGGKLVPPGIYLVKVLVKADLKSVVRTGTVGVVY